MCERESKGEREREREREGNRREGEKKERRGRVRERRMLLLRSAIVQPLFKSQVDPDILLNIFCTSLNPA